MTKPTGKVNPTYRLTEEDRMIVAVMGHLADLHTESPSKTSWKWSKAKVAKAFGVHPKTVLVCQRRYPRETA